MMSLPTRALAVHIDSCDNFPCISVPYLRLLFRQTDVMWMTLIFEHGLILIKICISNAIPDEPAQAIAEYRLQQDRKMKQLRKWNIEERTIT